MAFSELTTPAAYLLGGAGVSALTNWWAVAVENETVERIVKPLTVGLLIGLGVLLRPIDGEVRAWILAGLLFGLCGDVFLMPPKENFVAGLSSFLAGHVCYIVAFALERRSWWFLVAGSAVVVLALAFAGRIVVRAVRQKDPKLHLPVIVYSAVISLMVVAAFGTRNPWAIAGALAFFTSDGVLAFNRFVSPVRGGHLAVMVSYQLGQGCIVLSLLH